MVNTNEQTFMTPAQQREYLAELRRQNAEMYGLTGVRSKPDNQDPWTTTAPRASTISAKSNYTSTSSESRHGPPKPPKSSQLRNASASLDQSRHQAVDKPGPDNGHSGPQSIDKPRPKVQPKPMAKPLPRPPTVTSTGSADPSRLEITKKHPPQIARKPETPEKENASNSTRVSFSLTNYDIPQYGDQITHDESSHDERYSQQIDTPAFAIDEAKKVTIPIFSFSDEGCRSSENDVVSDSAIDSNSNSSMPTFSVTSPDGASVLPASRKTEQEGSSRRQRNVRSPIPEAQQIQVERGLRCANCYETFGRGRIITANGKRYHPSHFTCFECGIPLEHVDFYTHETKNDHGQIVADEVYCHFDYHELFSPRCHVCTTPVIRDGIRALGHVYHAEHFFCALCSKTFKQEGSIGTEFVEKDDLPWHPKCYEEKFSQAYTCRKCKQKIPAGTQVITLGTGSHFHHECFQCALCKSSLEEGFYWSNNKEGVCKSCRATEVKRDY